MLFNKKNNEAIDKAKQRIMEAHNILLTAMNESDVLTEDYDREQLRKIRDMNIKTILLIKELEMREML